MKEIYLVRHGETEWNAAGRYQGKLDSPLTEFGISQAEAIGKKLAELDIQADALIVSPLGRTRQTAAIISRFAALPAMRFDENLAEVSIGSWDGLTDVDIDAEWPNLLDNTTQFDWFFRSPDGESYDAAVERATEWIRTTSGVIIAVSHGLFGRIIRGTYLGLSKTETLSLPVPQDVIWRMAGGRIDPIAVA